MRAKRCNGSRDRRIVISSVVSNRPMAWGKACLDG